MHLRIRYPTMVLAFFFSRKNADVSTNLYVSFNLKKLLKEKIFWKLPN